MAISSSCSPWASACSSVRSTRQFGLFGVGLRLDRYVLPGGHRHCPRDQTGDPRDHDVAVRRLGRGHPQHQTRGRHDAVVRAQDRRPEPADASGAVSFPMVSCHACGLRAVGGIAHPCSPRLCCGWTAQVQPWDNAPAASSGRRPRSPRTCGWPASSATHCTVSRCSGHLSA